MTTAIWKQEITCWIPQRRTERIPHWVKAIRFVATVASSLVLVACGNGVSLSHEVNFMKVKPGMTRHEVVAALESEPLLTESYNLAGFEVARYALIDVKHSYAIVLAATPMSEARVIATARTPNVK